ncbi:DeoR/GlpR family DNA-binding transcription regulator [Methylobacterium sp. E-025]|jgi:DeoR family glycerol-3-phosphate regulon repressor|uniref:DeoR/GlpR family DNA-binding transcription regulator n=1 Tax=Methylobacterium sp. E-025 TaxID=2836561 RepID=UPI001FBB23C6|nr:DeoR/GlpR family DNA-binding transcription regulator [Methylobacterium sp. E-025]MCJ2113566.1 DeoR/GlpR family DNA-binding transcription regulator [Methylobacterium sp. E-025]
MLTDHRHQEILSRLHGTGRVGVADAAAFLKVSEETIRRDLKLMETRGLLRRIHGGAVAPRLDQDRPLIERGKTNPREKARVAAIAEGLVHDGMSIFIDTGTTTLALARRLIQRNLTLTTNSIDVALLLGGGPSRVNLTPGTLRPKDNALVGYETVAYARRYFFDIVFMGISACDLDRGWMDYEEHESVLRRTLRGQARRSVILADSHKFGLQANLCTFDLSDPLSVVTDRAPPAAFLDRFTRHDIDLIAG